MKQRSVASRASGSAVDTAPPVAPTEPRPASWRVWLLAARPNTLTASFTPVLVGAAFAWRDGHRRPGLAVAFWVFAGCIQIGTNLHNDYADFVRGADTAARVGQARAAQKGWLTPTQVCGGTCLVLSLAAVIGGALTAGAVGAAQPAAPMAFVTVTSIFNAFAYTGGPFPLG